MSGPYYGGQRRVNAGATFPLPLREREGTRAAGRVRGLAQDNARGTSPLTSPLLRNGSPPLPQGERKSIVERLPSESSRPLTVPLSPARNRGPAAPRRWRDRRPGDRRDRRADRTPPFPRRRRRPP